MTTVKSPLRGRRLGVRGMLGLLALALVISIILAFFFLPLPSVFVTMGPVESFPNLNTPIAYQALFLSLKTSFTSLVLIVAFGTPLVYWMPRSSFWGKRVLRSACRCR